MLLDNLELLRVVAEITCEDIKYLILMVFYLTELLFSLPLVNCEAQVNFICEFYWYKIQPVLSSDDNKI